MATVGAPENGVAAAPGTPGAADGAEAPNKRAETVTTADLIYFSSVSGNTARFVDKLGREAARIPLLPSEPRLRAAAPYVLVLPTYGGGNGEGAVPKQVIRFLNEKTNRDLIRGVISAGNTNFGEAYCIAGDIVAAKCHVPHLYRFELFGTPDDVESVSRGLDQLWKQQ